MKTVKLLGNNPWSTRVYVVRENNISVMVSFPVGKRATLIHDLRGQNNGWALVEIDGARYVTLNEQNIQVVADTDLAEDVLALLVERGALATDGAIYQEARALIDAAITT